MIDLAPLLTQVVIPLATPVVATAATWAFATIAGHFHMRIQDSQRELVNAVIQRGITYAASKVPASIPVSAGGGLKDMAAQYVIDHIPGALRSLGVTPAALGQMVEARLPTAPATVELVTPPY